MQEQVKRKREFTDSTGCEPADGILSNNKVRSMVGKSRRHKSSQLGSRLPVHVSPNIGQQATDGVEIVLSTSAKLVGHPAYHLRKLDRPGKIYNSISWREMS